MSNDLLGLLDSTVVQFHVLHRDEPFSDHCLDPGQDGVDSSGLVEDLDNDRKTVRRRHETGGFDSARVPETFDRPDDSGAGGAVTSGDVNYGICKRTVFEAIPLRYVDANQLCFDGIGF